MTLPLLQSRFIPLSCSCWTPRQHSRMFACTVHFSSRSERYHCVRNLRLREKKSEDIGGKNLITVVIGIAISRFFSASCCLGAVDALSVIVVIVSPADLLFRPAHTLLERQMRCTWRGLASKWSALWAMIHVQLALSRRGAAPACHGELLSQDLVSACLDRIAGLEPSVQAWAFLDRDRALEQARAADAQHKESKGVGALHGVPVGLKDIIDTADMPTENGSDVFKGRQPADDALVYGPAACRPSSSASGPRACNPTPSRSVNPVNLDPTPGGSYGFRCAVA